MKYEAKLFLFSALFIVHCIDTGKSCTTDEFQCTSGLCISERLRCNDDLDCNDFSDELNCTVVSVCPEGMFKCTNGECVTSSALCDGVRQCTDGSDEQGCIGSTFYSNSTIGSPSTISPQPSISDTTDHTKDILSPIMITIAVLFFLIIIICLACLAWKKSEGIRKAARNNAVVDSASKEIVHSDMHEEMENQSPQPPHSHRVKF